MTSVKDESLQSVLRQFDTLIDLHCEISASDWIIQVLYKNFFEQFKACICLFKAEPFIAPALVILRTAYEDSLAICYLIADPETHIPQFQDSANFFALKDIQKIKERHPNPPAFFDEFIALLEISGSEKIKPLKVENYIDKIKALTPALFNDYSTKNYALDSIAYFYGTAVTHVQPYALREIYVNQAPRIGVKGILLCLISCSILIRSYLRHYGCVFPDQIDILEGKILDSLNKIPEIRN